MNQARECITLTAKEVAPMLGISYWMVTQLCKRGKLPHFRIGKRILFNKETMIEWTKKTSFEAMKIKEHGRGLRPIPENLKKR